MYSRVRVCVYTFRSGMFMSVLIFLKNSISLCMYCFVTFLHVVTFIGDVSISLHIEIPLGGVESWRVFCRADK